MLVSFWLSACATPASDAPDVRTPPTPVEAEDNFGDAGAVRITAPVQGE